MFESLHRWWFRPSRHDILQAVASDVQRLHLVIRLLSQSKAPDKGIDEACLDLDIIARHLEEIVHHE